MQPPITVGTVLQNRYRIIQTLGQGGFGRTFLAEDQRRFNELCAIKELIPTTMEAFAWEKAKELFQREAASLYQIEHPQVPKFRERFEQDQRLFLVQDYVAGKTYRTLLDERKERGAVFTEAEVMHLLRSLLPVLEYIHRLGIIHRDISPENIILRDGDSKPVLIDFGVVKELATRLQSPDNATPATYVGKLGYSPSEQLQTGQAYPSSDLYALAVTAIVLLTGKKPTELFDDSQLTWNWQRWATVSPRFAAVLNRMLNYRPRDRYQSTTEVAQALQTLEQATVPPNSHLSNAETVAVGRRPEPISRAPYRPDPRISQPSSNSFLDNPLAIGAIGSAVVILAGLASWTIVGSIRKSPKESSATPQTFPSPVIAGSATATPTPTRTSTATRTPTPKPTQINNQPVVFRQRLNFGASHATNLERDLKENQTIYYIFNADKGQKLTALFVQESGVLLTVLGPNRKPIDNTAKDVKFYQGSLPSAGLYTIQVTPIAGFSRTNYNLNVGLENQETPTPTPTPTLTPTPTPTPTPTQPFPTPTPTPTQTFPTPTPTPTQTQSKSPKKHKSHPIATKTPKSASRESNQL